MFFLIDYFQHFSNEKRSNEDFIDMDLGSQLCHNKSNRNSSGLMTAAKVHMN